MQMRFYLAAILLQFVLMAKPALAQDKANSRSHERAENFVILNDSTIVTTKTMELNTRVVFNTNTLQVRIDGGKVYRGIDILCFKAGEAFYTKVDGVDGGFAKMFKDGRIKLFILFLGGSASGYSTSTFYQLDSEKPQLLLKESLLDTFVNNPKYLAKAKELPGLVQSDRKMMKLIKEFNEEFPVK
jgi:hypothetical protein